MTSKLEQYLSNKLYTRFGHLHIKQNYRPYWMEGLELDFYIEELRLAAEVQGEQHYSYIEFFHRSKENFESQKDRDAKKSLICKERGIALVEVFTEKDADIFIKIVEEKSGIEKVQLPDFVKPKRNNTKMQKGQIKGYNKCVRNLWLYEHGIIQADETKVKMWRKTIEKGIRIKGHTLA